MHLGAMTFMLFQNPHYSEGCYNEVELYFKFLRQYLNILFLRFMVFIAFL